MSKLKNELTAIREALDTDHEYSGDYALQEEVANIRKLVENGAGSGGGSGVTVFPIIYGESGDYSYVEVEEAELLDALKSGIVIFRDAYEDDGVFAGATDHYVVSASNNDFAISISVDNGTVKITNWNYNDGRYNR